MSSKGNPYATKLNRGFDLLLLAVIVVTFVIFFRASAHGQTMDTLWASASANAKPKPTPTPTPRPTATPHVDGETDWKNTGTDWNTGTNWTAVSGSAPPAPGDVAWFKTAKTTNPNLSTSASIAGFYFGNKAGGTSSSGYDVTSSSTAIKFTLTGTAANTTGVETGNTTAAAIGADNTSGTNTIDAPIILGAAASSTQTFTQASGGTLIVNGVISNTNSNVTLSLAGGGIIQLGGANTYTGPTSVSGGTVNVTGSLGNTAVTVGAATLNLNNASAISQNVLTVNNASSVVTENTTNALGGTAALTQSNGTVTLSSANNFSGATALSGGILQLQNAGSIGSSALTLSGGTLQLRNDTNNTTFADASTTITNDVTINVDHTSTGTGNTLLLGNFSIGADTLTVTNADSYKLTMGDATLTGNPTFSPAAGATLTMGAINSGAPARTINFAGAGTTAVTGVINDASGSGNNTAVSMSGTGTAILSGNNSYSNGTTISNGTLRATTNATALGTGGVTLAGTTSIAPTLELANDTGLNFGRNVTLSSGNSGQVTFDINSDVLTNGNAGVTHTLGNLTISKSGGATLQINPGANVGSGVAGIVLGSVTSSDSSPTFSVASGAQLTIGGISFTTTGNRAIQFTGNGNTTVNGVIHDGTGSGNGSSVTKSGNGTLFLTQANSYTGVNNAAPSTTIDGGILNASVWANGGSNSSIGAGGSGASQLVIGGGTLQYTGSTAASTDRLFTIGDNGVLTATLDASGSGSGTLSFTNTGSIALAGSGARTLTLTGSNTGANTLAAVIGTGTGGATTLSKTGTGSWALTAANTYAGGTAVSAGSLFVNNASGSGTGSGTVTVNSSGTLGGSGTISGSVDMTAGSNNLAPGASGAGSIGTLHTGALTMVATSTLNIDIASTSSSDQVVASSVALNGATLAVSKLAGTINVNDKFFIVSNTGAGADGMFNGLANGATVTDNSGDTFIINYFDTLSGSANDISLTVQTVVPEPGTWTAGVLTALVLASASRARRRTRRASK